jgi:hypothetical protein
VEVLVLKQTRLFAAAAIAALLTACNGGGTAPPAPPPARLPAVEDRELTTVSTFVAQNDATGDYVRIYPTRDTIDALRATLAGQRELQATSPLTYHGGPVATTSCSGARRGTAAATRAASAHG